MNKQYSLLPALARAFKKGGITHQYNFPGFHSHELFSCLGGKITSTNEKIAYEMAWGSSQAGAKSLVTFKNVGLNDAADPFINSHLTGVGAGLVLVVFDDVELEGSQCILDSRHYFGFYGGLWLEPYSYESAMVLAEAAPALSEVFDIPVVMRLTNISLRFQQKGPVGYTARDICKLAKTAAGDQRLTVEPLVHPINGNSQHKMIAKKNRLIQSFTDALHKLINTSSQYTFIAVGSESEDADCFIVTLPIPHIEQSGLNKVQEVGDPVVANFLASSQGKAKFEIATIGYSSRNTQHYIRTARYERLLKLLKPYYKYIVGDLGEYTKDTLDTLSHCLCFGSCISVITGMALAGQEALAITGDASFFHSAKNAITEAQSRGLSLKIILLDNGGSQGTGGQKIPGKLDESIKTSAFDYDTITTDELSRKVGQFINDPTLTVLRVKHTA